MVGFTTHIPLMETENDIFEPVFILNLMDMHPNILFGQLESTVYSRVIKAVLFSKLVPQTYFFP